jgi:hypothetical protein
MDAERLALQVRAAGESSVRHSVITTVAQGRVPLTSAVSDVRRDWRRWSGVERICVIALGGLWAAGVMAAIFADAHLP